MFDILRKRCFQCFWERVTGVSLCLVKTVVAILNTSKTLDEAFISKGWITIKTVILRNAILSAFSKSIKQLTHAGCQSEIPLNSSRFRSNRKFCYQSATKFSKMFWVGVGVYFTLDIWLEWHLRKYLGINSPNYFLYWCVGRCFLGGYRSNFWNGVIDWAW